MGKKRTKNKKIVKDVKPSKPSSKFNDFFNPYLIILVAVISISSLYFLIKFWGLDDVTNNYIKYKASAIFYLQIFSYLLSIVSFSYFGFCLLTKKQLKKYDKYALIASFLAVIILHILSFNQALDTNGDNNRYISYAKSFAQTGEFNRIYFYKIKPVVSDPVGLSLLLSPIIAIFGVSVFKMKLLVFLCLISSLVFLFMIIRKIANQNIAAIITILFGTHPYIVQYSSMIMTEIPYIFWSLVAIWSILKYEEKEKIHWGFLVLSIVSIFMTYLTRAIGAGFTLAVFFYFLIKLPVKDYIKAKSFNFIKSIEFRKFVLIVFLLFIIFLGWQVKGQATSGSSQAKMFTQLNIFENVFTKSLPDMWKIFAQNIYAADMVRWKPSPVGLKWIIVTILAFCGMFVSMFKKQIIGIYSFFVLLLLIVGNKSVTPIVFSRYMIPFTPFLIYFLYIGTKFCTEKITKNKYQPVTMISLLILFLILPSSYSGSGFIIQRNRTGRIYQPAVANYIECAKWAADNLPEDAVVTSRKEAFFFTFSGLKGYKHTTSYMNYSKEWEKERLEIMKDRNTSYLVLDSFNPTTRRNIVPIIQNNPEKFKMIKKFGSDKEGPCYLFEINKWW